MMHDCMNRLHLSKDLSIDSCWWKSLKPLSHPHTHSLFTETPEQGASAASWAASSDPEYSLKLLEFWCLKLSSYSEYTRLSKDILNLVQNDPKLPQEDLKDSAKVPTKYVNLDCSAKRPVDTPKYQKYLILTKTTRNYPFLPHEKLPSV